MVSAAESFLVDFHARFTGATSAALGDVPVRCAGREYGSSYALLAASVPAHAGSVLDLACGDGFLLSLLARQCSDAALVGIDMSAAELAAAGKRLQGRARLREGRAQQLPFAGGTFDAVTCHMALMLMEEPQRVLAEIHRVLRGGGVLAAVIGAALPASPVLDRYRALLQPQIAAAGTAVPIGDRRWRDDAALRDMLTAAGFASVRQDSVEGELKLAPAAMWDWFMLMYDAHFVDAATREALRGEYLGAVAPLAAADGALHLPLAWRLVTATRGA